jgi:hypothetical protein
MPTADVQQPVSLLRSDPAMHAVSDDVVKQARFLRQVHQIRTFQANVAQAKLSDPFPTSLDLPLIQVDGIEFRIRQRRGHRDDVVTLRTTQLQDPAASARLRKRLETKQSSDGRYSIWMRLRVSSADVRNDIMAAVGRRAHRIKVEKAWIMSRGPNAFSPRKMLAHPTNPDSTRQLGSRQEVQAARAGVHASVRPRWRSRFQCVPTDP